MYVRIKIPKFRQWLIGPSDKRSIRSKCGNANEQMALHHMYARKKNCIIWFVRASITIACPCIFHYVFFYLRVCTLVSGFTKYLSHVRYQKLSSKWSCGTRYRYSYFKVEILSLGIAGFPRYHEIRKIGICGYTCRNISCHDKSHAKLLILEKILSVIIANFSSWISVLVPCLIFKWAQLESK